MKIDKFASNIPIKKLSILIAAYNEASTILPAIEDLITVLGTLSLNYEVIVIESNSTDGTRQLLLINANRLGFSLILEESAKGKGSAIRLGMSKMTGDVFLIYDADSEYSASDIPLLLEPIANGRTSFVLGTRHEKGSPMRVMPDHLFISRLMNIAHKIFTFLINTCFMVNLTDPFTMYKVFRTEIFLGVKLVSNRFDLDWELVEKAIRLGAKPIEVPVFYEARSFSQGKKVRLFRDPLTWLVALVKFRFSRL